jgi:hypothetical protein
LKILVIEFFVVINQKLMLNGQLLIFAVELSNDVFCVYVFFFSSRLRAWQAVNLAFYNLTTATLCDSSWGDIFVSVPFLAGQPGVFAQFSYDPVISGKNASNVVWFDTAGQAHHQSIDNSTSVHLVALQRSLPLDKRGMLKMYHCGPVMTEPTTMYVTFYGSWASNRDGPTLLSALPILISGLGGTQFWGMLSQSYFNASSACECARSAKAVRADPFPLQTPLPRPLSSGGGTFRCPRRPWVAPWMTRKLL